MLVGFHVDLFAEVWGVNGEWNVLLLFSSTLDQGALPNLGQVVKIAQLHPKFKYLLLSSPNTKTKFIQKATDNTT